MADHRLSHIRADGTAAMVDVGGKPITERVAIAEGFVRISEELHRAIAEGSIAKGPVLETARIAGIMAAKRTDELIPLCHSMALDAVDIAMEMSKDLVRVVATVRTHSRTGVEMEALTAVSVACLTIYDMGKAIDKAMVIEGIRLVEKRGGRSGTYIAPSGASS